MADQPPTETLEQYRIRKLEEGFAELKIKIERQREHSAKELAKLQDEFDAYKERSQRVVEQYEAQIEDSTQISRAIKIAVGTMLGSALITGLVLPLVSHFLK